MQDEQDAAPGPAANAVETARREMALVADNDVDGRRARAITDLAVRVAALALGCGATAARTTELVHRVTDAYNLPVQLDVTYSRIILSYEPSVNASPITIMRAVRADVLDFDRLERLEHLVADVQDGQLDLPTASARVNHVAAAPFTHPRWFQLMAAALLGATIAMLIGGGALDMAVSAVSTMLVDEIRRWLERYGLGAFFTTAACAAVPTALTLLAVASQRWGLVPAGLHPSFVIAAGMVSLLAGMGVVNAANDAIDANYLGAAARGLEVLVTTGGIVLGLMATLWAGRTVGVAARLEPDASQTPHVWLQLVAAGLVALGFGVRCMMRPRALAASTLLGVLLWGCYLAGGWVTPSHPARVGMAALAVGLVARLVTHWQRIPFVALATTATAALMPGMMLYRGVFAITDEDPAAATWLLLGSAYVAVGLAAGTSFGAMLAAIVLHWRQLHAGRREELVLVEQAHG